MFPVQKIIFLCLAVHLGHTQGVNFCLFGIQLLFFLLVPISLYSFLTNVAFAARMLRSLAKDVKFRLPSLMQLSSKN